MTPMWISVLQTIIIRVPLAYTIAYLTRSETLPNGAHQSIFISLLVSWVIGACVTTIIYKKGNWKAKAIEAQN